MARIVFDSLSKLEGFLSGCLGKFGLKVYCGYKDLMINDDTLRLGFEYYYVTNAFNRSKVKVDRFLLERLREKTGLDVRGLKSYLSDCYREYCKASV